MPEMIHAQLSLSDSATPLLNLVLAHPTIGTSACWRGKNDIRKHQLWPHNGERYEHLKRKVIYCRYMQIIVRDKSWKIYIIYIWIIRCFQWSVNGSSGVQRWCYSCSAVGIPFIQHLLLQRVSKLSAWYSKTKKTNVTHAIWVIFVWNKVSSKSKKNILFWLIHWSNDPST